MPYITQARAEYLLSCHVRSIEPRDVGELNFLITRMLMNYLNSHPVHYADLNDCLGTLEGAKLEFFRRVVVPYEEQKRQQNGDVYSS